MPEWFANYDTRILDEGVALLLAQGGSEKKAKRRERSKHEEE